jgi:hypothetical protein
MKIATRAVGEWWNHAVDNLFLLNNSLHYTLIKQCTIGQPHICHNWGTVSKTKTKKKNTFGVLGDGVDEDTDKKCFAKGIKALQCHYQMH